MCRVVYVRVQGSANYVLVRERFRLRSEWWNSSVLHHHRHGTSEQAEVWETEHGGRAIGATWLGHLPVATS